MKMRLVSDRKHPQLSSRSPALSVVVVTVYDSEHLSRCLDALMNQVDPPTMEIIAVYHERVPGIQALMEEHPEVIFLLAPGDQTQDRMLALGINRTRGGIIALTVDHCTPERHWCRRMVDAHASGHGAIGGGLEFGDQPSTAANWAVHLYDYCSYGYYQFPVKNGPARELSDCNVSYRREVLTSIADRWTDSFHVPIINRLLGGSGTMLRFSSGLLVYQHRSIDFASAARIAYTRGRAFASARVGGYGFMKRLRYTLLSPLLPAKLIAKLLVNMLPKGAHRMEFARAFPLIVIFLFLWSAGEFKGFLTGRRGEVILVTQE